MVSARINRKEWWLTGLEIQNHRVESKTYNFHMALGDMDDVEQVGFCFTLSRGGATYLNVN